MSTPSPTHLATNHLAMTHPDGAAAPATPPAATTAAPAAAPVAAPGGPAPLRALREAAGAWAAGNLRHVAVSLGSILVGILIWHLATLYRVEAFVSFRNVPTPTAVAAALAGHLAGGEFYLHILVSLQRTFSAFLSAAVLGIVLGTLMGRSRLVRAMVVPYIEILRPIPAVAWIPLAILMWPTEEASIIFITFLGALFPIILNTLHGVEQTPEILVRAAKSLGASRMQIFWNVILPAALPSIAAGLAIGMGVSWFSLLAGEIISGQYGIGYFTWNAYSLINYPDIVVGMLVIGALGTLSTYAVRLATRPFLAWQRRTR
ncbi:ABC transporter permease [Azospirillum sp. ST 5-10]|uniref:ABC transporter permease n=1 Tax=unclassified Azospirillum TaxID=2630922 RepID=UPI003F4A20D7